MDPRVKLTEVIETLNLRMQETIGESIKFLKAISQEEAEGS